MTTAMAPLPPLLPSHRRLQPLSSAELPSPTWSPRPFQTLMRPLPLLMTWLRVTSCISVWTFFFFSFFLFFFSDFDLALVLFSIDSPQHVQPEKDFGVALQRAHEELRATCEHNRLLTEKINALQQQLQQQQQQQQTAQSQPLQSDDSVKDVVPQLPTPEVLAEIGSLTTTKAQLMCEFLASTRTCRETITSFLSLRDVVTSSLSASLSKYSAMASQQSAILGLLEQQQAHLTRRDEHQPSPTATSLPSPPVSSPLPEHPELNSTLETRAAMRSLVDELQQANEQVCLHLHAVTEGEKALQVFQSWLLYITNPDAESQLAIQPPPAVLLHEHAALQQQLADFHAALESLRHEEQGTKEKLQLEAAANSSLTDRLHQLNQELQASGEENAKLTSQLEGVSTRVEALSVTLRDRETALRELEEERTRVATLFKAKEERVEELSGTLKGLQEQVALDQTDQLALELVQKGYEIAALVSELESLSADAATLEGNLKGAEAEILELRALLEQSMIELSDANTQLVHKTQEKASAAAAMVIQLEEKDAECLDLRETLKNRASDLADAETQFTSLAQEMGVVRQVLSLSFFLPLLLSETFHSFTSSLSSFQEYDQLFRVLQEKLAAFQSQSEELETSKHLHGEASLQLAQERGHISELQAQLLTQSTEISRLEGECQAATAVHSELVSLKDQLEAKESSVLSLTEEIGSLQRQMQESRAALEEELASARGQVESTTSSIAAAKQALQEQGTSLQLQHDDKTQALGRHEEQLADLKSQVEAKGTLCPFSHPSLVPFFTILFRKCLCLLVQTLSSLSSRKRSKPWLPYIQILRD